MPIRINLLAETQALEELRRRDPLKRAIWLGGLVVAAVLAWSGWLQFQIIQAKAELQRQQGAWQSKEKSYQDITDKQKKIADTERKLSALNRLSTNRFLWGSVLNAFQQTLVEQVYLTRLKGDQSYTVIEGIPTKTIDGKVMQGKPSVSVEKIVITLDGKDTNPADQNYNKFKSAIAGFPFFQRTLQKTDFPRLTSLSQPVPEPGDPGRNSVQFTLELNYPEVRRDE